MKEQGRAGCQAHDVRVDAVSVAACRRVVAVNGALHLCGGHWSELVRGRAHQRRVVVIALLALGAESFQQLFQGDRRREA